MADVDFDEEDVWAVVKDSSPMGRKLEPVSLSSSTPRRLSGASRMIPKSRGLQESAPVNIPDWSKIYRITGWRCGSVGGRGGENEDEEDEEEEEEERVPPHEWIAKKLARTQISSFSVCEGAGRTLKGRDLRKVRNAVLTRTGFLE